MNSEIYTLDEAQKLLNSPRPDTGFAFYFFSRDSLLTWWIFTRFCSRQPIIFLLNNMKPSIHTLIDQKGRDSFQNRGRLNFRLGPYYLPIPFPECLQLPFSMHIMTNTGSKDHM